MGVLSHRERLVCYARAGLELRKEINPSLCSMLTLTLVKRGIRTYALRFRSWS